MAAKQKKPPVKGRDLAAPADRMTLDGVSYQLKFDMKQARIAEDIYELKYGRSVSYFVIAQHLAQGRLGAIMAVYYAAMISGGADMTWEEFDGKFRLDALPGVKEWLLENVMKSLPQTEGEAKRDPQ